MAVTEPICLVTGWEPEVPVGDTLLRRFVHALADSLAGPIQALGGRVAHSDALVAADLGRPASYYNGVTLLRPPDPGGWSPVIDEVERLLLAGPVTGDVYLWSPWATPDLRRRGWVLEGHPPLLFRPPGGSLPPAAAGLEVRAVSDAVALAEWERVVVEGYPFDDLVPWRPRVLFDQRVLDTPLRLWLGCVGGRPVGAAASYIAHGFHVLALGVVLPEARRRGYWETLLGRGSPNIPGFPRGPCSAT
ncbi:MAG TPA: N-acetyltransferase [Actinomycetota bacterium]|nr:N-acetyltransferase [Actinomycetota bacterium]